MIPRDLSRDENDLMVIIDYLATFSIFDVQRGVTQQDLAWRTGIPEGSVGTVIEEGLTRGWLMREARTRGPGRGGIEYAIFLSPAGREIAPKIRSARLTAGEVARTRSGQ